MTGISRKWFFEVISIISIVIFIVSALLVVIISRSYYRTVETTLNTNASDLLSSYFSLYGNDSSENFAQGGREFIENFTGSDIMEAWVIDSEGKVILSSSGFEIEQSDMPDYNEALRSDSGRAIWTGRTSTGERIMSETTLISSGSGVAGAVRFMISLKYIDSQIISIIIITAVVSLAFLALIIFVSSRFYVKTIVRPVRNVCSIAERIAGGDLDARVEQYNDDDEIGMLCEKINDMATELESADKMKNDFISTVSHELRTPLTAIKGWGETLIQIGETDPATSKRGMEVILDETGRLNEMVEELLDFSRMSNGRMSLNIEKIDVLAELDETVFAFRERAAREGIEISYNVPPVPVPADADASRIKQVFVNILDNAIKYTHQGGRITVKAELERPKTLRIIFTDNGKGIAPDDLPKVKEKFFKADSTVRGSGIGLAVVDEIMKLHKGDFTIDSILGEGTTVTLTLPVDEIPEEEVAISEQQ
ncbi:MAG: HAMP domain-containing histidine kinase [Clostridia bacterium]|nr:HAMP domain-containing histidine kinase [Clostridia bacterium]